MLVTRMIIGGAGEHACERGLVGRGLGMGWEEGTGEVRSVCDVFCGGSGSLGEGGEGRVLCKGQV